MQSRVFRRGQPRLFALNYQIHFFNPNSIWTTLLDWTSRTTAETVISFERQLNHEINGTMKIVAKQVQKQMWKQKDDAVQLDKYYRMQEERVEKSRSLINQIMQKLNDKKG